MKLFMVCVFRNVLKVAPLVGAWIEIYMNLCLLKQKPVAPLVGAWIEISNTALNVLGVFRRSSCRSVD